MHCGTNLGAPVGNKNAWKHGAFSTVAIARRLMPKLTKWTAPRGSGELAARLGAADHDRLEHCAGCVDRGGVAGRPGADDDDFRVHRKIP